MLATSNWLLILGCWMLAVDQYSLPLTSVNGLKINRISLALVTISVAKVNYQNLL
jgi:hypothetical protein